MDIAAFGLLAYLVIAGLVLVDSIVPVVPSEIAVVAAAGASATGELSVVGVLLAAAVGAFGGDVLVHLLGRSASGRWLRSRADGRGDHAVRPPCRECRASGAGPTYSRRSGGRTFPLEPSVGSNAPGAGVGPGRWLPMAAPASCCAGVSCPSGAR